MVTFHDIQDFVLNSTEAFIIFMLILFFTVIAAKIVSMLLRRFFKKSSRFIKVDETKYHFITHVTTAIIYVIGGSMAIYTIPSFRTLAISLFAGAGILAVIVGFASQQAFSNVVAGIFIVIFKPFRVGERIKVGDDAGIVEDITLRHTVIRNFENKRIIIPNSVISNEKIENWDAHDEKICRLVEIGIGYDSDVDRAMKIIQDEAMKHPNYIDNRTKDEKEKGLPEVPVRLIGFGDSSVNLRAYVWAKDSVSAFIMGCDLNKSIKERFDREGIEIPFPYRTIVQKKDIDKEAARIRKASKKLRSARRKR
ncbi:mechanosensitive ion channel family protein [Candidatus Woesearchaeota archaeon]|nr:mechanosensitive ion channel family protein [Candidatus Woesearchaeota archaeon]